MVTVQLECKLRKAGSLTCKDPAVSYQVGLLGRAARDDVSRTLLLDWPGAGIHLHLSGRVHSVAVVMTIERQNFFDVHVDDKIMTLGSSRKALSCQRFYMVTNSNLTTRDADLQIVIRKASEATGGHACVIHYLDIEVEYDAPNKPALLIEPGGEPREVLEVLGDSSSVGLHYCIREGCEWPDGQPTDFRRGWVAHLARELNLS
eukprot:3948258-Amphidinium_carterae.1